MDTNKMDIKTKLSTLWIVVMVNVIMADIFSFMLDSMQGPDADVVQVTQVIMLVFAFIMEIPIVMIFLSRVLKDKANRWANIIASIITIGFVIAGKSDYLHYYFFAAIEIACMLIIIRDAWKWMKQEA
jgi:Family of unknown function (DUF6326)